jgi:hypothetical protein
LGTHQGLQCGIRHSLSSPSGSPSPCREDFVSHHPKSEQAVLRRGERGCCMSERGARSPSVSSPGPPLWRISLAFR